MPADSGAVPTQPVVVLGIWESQRRNRKSMRYMYQRQRRRRPMPVAHVTGPRHRPTSPRRVGEVRQQHLARVARHPTHPAVRGEHVVDDGEVTGLHAHLRGERRAARGLAYDSVTGSIRLRYWTDSSSVAYHSPRIAHRSRTLRGTTRYVPLAGTTRYVPLTRPVPITRRAPRRSGSSRRREWSR